MRRGRCLLSPDPDRPDEGLVGRFVVDVACPGVDEVGRGGGQLQVGVRLRSHAEVIEDAADQERLAPWIIAGWKSIEDTDRGPSKLIECRDRHDERQTL